MGTQTLDVSVEQLSEGHQVRFGIEPVTMKRVMLLSRKHSQNPDGVLKMKIYSDDDCGVVYYTIDDRRKRDRGRFSFRASVKAIHFAKCGLLEGRYRLYADIGPNTEDALFIERVA